MKLLLHVKSIKNRRLNYCYSRIISYLCEMKRIYTILVSVLVLLIAVQPILTFHFCSGTLASIEISSSDEASGCCSDSSSDNTSNEQIIGGSCCHTSVLNIKTDNYLQQDKDQQVVPFSVLTFIHVRNIVADIVSEPTLSSKRKNPPVYLLTEGREILMRFCVYII